MVCLPTFHLGQLSHNGGVAFAGGIGTEGDACLGNLLEDASEWEAEDAVAAAGLKRDSSMDRLYGGFALRSTPVVGTAEWHGRRLLGAFSCGCVRSHVYLQALHDVGRTHGQFPEGRVELRLLFLLLVEHPLVFLHRPAQPPGLQRRKYLPWFMGIVARGQSLEYMSTA